MDLDKNEIISKTELALWIMKSLQFFDAEDLDEDFELADNDPKDQKLSFEEYVETMYGIPKKTLQTYNSDTLADGDGNGNSQPFELREFNRLYNREFAKFIAADMNEDGFLTKEEYELFFDPSKEPKSLDFAIEEAKEKVDKNADNKIDFEEYKNDVNVIQEVSDIEELETLKEMFELLDLNGDNELSNEELYLWIQQDNGQIAADEAQHLLEMGDVDEDGKLSFVEIFEIMGTFLESDATQYGNMLRDGNPVHDEL